ncbi:UNVERIFIED_CONTAM: hypothetical protein HDU68_010063 [Siphonaria sp. JEL0065]|nr:hypothetical protein HDU68_010063 [Siphonaria sp. JEL0065]
MIPSAQDPIQMMHQAGNIAFGYTCSPVSPIYPTANKPTAAYSAAATRSPQTPQGTSNASNSKSFMDFTSHLVLHLCRETKMPQLSASVLAHDMMEYVSSVLSTTQVSLSIVVLALGTLHKIQRKVNALKQSGPVIATPEPIEWSLEQGSGEILERMSGKMSIKALFVVALMIAMKSPNGCCNTFTNKTWSQVALIPAQVLNSLEMDVCLFLGFDLWDKEAEYLSWLNVVRIAAEQYSLKARMLMLAQRQKQFLASPPLSPVAQVNGNGLSVLRGSASLYNDQQQHQLQQQHKFLKAARVTAQSPYQRVPPITNKMQPTPMYYEAPPVSSIYSIATSSSSSFVAPFLLMPLQQNQRPMFQLPRPF